MFPSPHIVTAFYHVLSMLEVNGFIRPGDPVLLAACPSKALAITGPVDVFRLVFALWVTKWKKLTMVPSNQKRRTQGFVL